MAVIPDKNPKALIGYYLGFGSLLPCVGLLFVIPAIILSIMGLNAAKRQPEIQGAGHAVVGLILAIIGGVIWGGLSIIGIIGSLAGR